MPSQVVLMPPGSSKRILLSESEYRAGLRADILGSGMPFPSVYGFIPLFDSLSLEALVAYDNALFGALRPGFSVTLALVN